MALVLHELRTQFIAFFAGTACQPSAPGLAAQPVYGAIQPVDTFVRDTPDSACDAVSTMLSNLLGNGRWILVQKFGDLSE